MEVKVSGQRLDLGSSLTEYIQKIVPTTISHFFPNATSTSVTIKKKNRKFKCDIVVFDGTGQHHNISAKNTAEDAYKAFNISLTAVRRQMRHVKGKLSSRQLVRKSKEKAKEHLLAGKEL